MVAFVDYQQASTSRGEYVLLRVGGVYLQYNRAKDFNSGTGSHQDEVVFVQEEDLTSSPVYSVLLGGLREHDSTSLNGVTYEVCSFGTEDSYDYADLRIYPMETPSTCSMQPTTIMVNEPTPSPVRATSSPTLNPTTSPSLRPTHQTPNPTLGPTPPPTISLTSSSTPHPNPTPSPSPSPVGPVSRRTVLIVRVLGNSGAEQPSESRERLAGAVFGIGRQPFPNSMRAQFNRCSFGQLDFVPATGYSPISNGVLDVRLGYSLQGRLIYSIRADSRAEAARLLGLSSLAAAFDHVMFCVAPGTNTGGLDSWTSFATRPGYESYFSSGSCDKLSGLMRQMGHNINLVGSSTPSDQNGDMSGMVSG